jgi:hypothetical protein
VNVKGVTWTVVVEILKRVLIPLWAAISVELRKRLEDALVQFYRNAQSTPNPWDDFLASLLLASLGIPEPKV